MKLHPNPRPRMRRRGLVLVWVGLVGIVVVLFLGLAIDTGYVALAGHQLQNAADAAALAGVWEVRDDVQPDGTYLAQTRAAGIAKRNAVSDAQAKAKVDILLAPNPANAASGDIVIGVWNSSGNTFTPTLVSPNACKVTARRDNGSLGGKLPLLFAPAIGGYYSQDFASTNVSKTAIAVMGGPSIGAGLILLNRTADSAAALTGTGSQVKINIPNGAVQINSSSTTALSWTGNPTISASAVYIGGNVAGASSIVSSGTVGINSPPVDDPLASLPIPPQGSPQTGSGNTLSQGYYNNNFPNRSVTLNPGIYFIDGGINLKGNTIITANNVMLFINSGGISMGGNSKLNITPPTSGTYAGISIYQRRGNTTDATLQGYPGGTNSGTFYFPTAHLEVAGTPTAFASQIIADTMHVQGNGQVNISYDGRFPIQGHKIWLVQ